MHLLIPFAFCSSEGCSRALRTLKLPHLEKLLSRLTPMALDRGDEFSLSPPHERALARARGLPVADGLIPWAALHAQAFAGSWGFITPCHWQVSTQHIAMSGPELPDFPAQESQALLAAMQPFFEEDGITLQFDQPSRWLACGAALEGLSTASLDRVAGRHVSLWMPDGARAARLRRLQSEMQMLLYTHPVNEARIERGVPPVNSFWLSGTGALPDAPQEPAMHPEPVLVTALRDAAVNEDWPAWTQAWQALDANQCATLLTVLDQSATGQLTLCGERHAQSFTARRQTHWQRWMTIFNRQPAPRLLETL